ncbi:MAG TPA: PilZ domain-containing protein [Candidatus Sulfotelmatobacter sp.]|nr:PilZ domain-containing protein [Candidatus Sulfotelmatobacter sp.]
MNSPQRQERRDVRYPLHLPVLIRMSRKEMHTRSVNISLGGILLSSDVLIPEGSTVEVAVGVKHMPDPGILLSARGKVLRAEPRETGDYAVAIKLDRCFELPVADEESHRRKQKVSRPPRPVPRPALQFATAWHTET